MMLWLVITSVFSVVKIIGYTLSPILKAIFRFVFRKPRQKPNFKNDIILITGAAQGVGKDLAIEFAKHGGTLILWDINETKLQETCSQITSQGYEAFAYVVDCSKKDEIYQTAERVKEEVGNVSVLVNNAGIMHGKSILDLKEEEVELSFKINTLAHFWLVRAFLPWMLDNNYGYIVNILSAVVFNGFPKLWDYCASKSAALSFSESLRAEIHKFNRQGVSVTAICPWHINTKMFEGFRTRLHRVSPVLKTRDVAKAIVEATYDRRFYVVLPSALILPYILKMLLPIKAITEMTSLLLGNDYMDNYNKHNKQQ